MKNIEMHCHTTLSDGKNTQDEIIAEAQRLDLDFLALTDHDTISPQEFQAGLLGEGIETCDSVEVSARNEDLDKSLHLVSYAKIFNSSLHEVLNDSRAGKMRMKWGQFYKLINKFGFTGEPRFFDMFMRKLGRQPETSNKYDMSRYFMSNPENRERAKNILGELCSSNDVVLHFYLECLKREGALYDKYGYESQEYEPSVDITVEEVVQKSGGLVSMAHPNVTFSDKKGGISEFQRTIGDYVKRGVRGIEVNSIAPYDWVQAILKVRQKHDLILTFGSDCHEIGKTDTKHSTIGRINPFVETELLRSNFSRFKNNVGLGEK